MTDKELFGLAAIAALAVVAWTEHQKRVAAESALAKVARAAQTGGLNIPGLGNVSADQLGAAEGFLMTAWDQLNQALNG